MAPDVSSMGRDDDRGGAGVDGCGASRAGDRRHLRPFVREATAAPTGAGLVTGVGDLMGRAECASLSWPHLEPL